MTTPTARGTPATRYPAPSPSTTPKPITPFKVNFWARFNRFHRPTQAPQVTFRGMTSDPDTCLVQVNGKTVGTLNRRPSDWFLLTALTGERATLAADDVELILVGVICDRRDLGAAIKYALLGNP